jgi:hypothetical protein
MPPDRDNTAATISSESYASGSRAKADSAGFRLLVEYEERRAALDKALAECDSSGPAAPLDLDALLAGRRGDPAAQAARPYPSNPHSPGPANSTEFPAGSRT